MRIGPDSVSLRTFLLALVLLSFLMPACGPAVQDDPVEADAPSPPTLEALAPRQPFVTSDTDPLRAALVLPLSEHLLRTLAIGIPGGHPLVRSQPMGKVAEHAQLVEALTENGVRVLDVRDLAEEAIQEARRQGALEDWLKEAFPVSAPRAIERLEEIDADSLFNQRDDHFYLEDEDHAFDPIFPGVPSMYWARDWAISTPRGLVIGNGMRFGRSRENHVARLIFRFAPSLDDIPVAFDAAQHDVNLDGGDTIVLDADTLLLGVDNRSSREAAPLLAQELGMDVLAVSMPPRQRAGALRRSLLHLDTIFNIVDHKKAVALPFFLEKEYSESNPLKNILTGLARQVEAMAKAHPDYEFSGVEDIQTTIDAIPEVGWVTRYAAGSGEEEALEMKLVDYFRQEGYQIIPVGGERGQLPLTKYFLERVLYELNWQGANVVQIEPGHVLAYRHNTHTNEALRQAGVHVTEFDGDLLAHHNGGPHCLVMPLLRWPQRPAAATD
ncbi:MAG TPA: arginine deiminase family protein [Acidobacteriota bacterium]|nr:arginine deiminase family protein [Acidobacteriota bacterium]